MLTQQMLEEGRRQVGMAAAHMVSAGIAGIGEVHVLAPDGGYP